MAKITLIGLERYMEAQDTSLFDNMYVPPQLDKSKLKNFILLNVGEFASLYGDPEFIKNAVQMWSECWKDTFDKWVEVWKVNYNPIHNFDRNEENEDIHSTSSTGNSALHTTGTDSESMQSSGTNVDKVQGFDSSDFKDNTKSDSTRNDARTSGSDTESNTRTNSSTNESLSHKAHLYGNIGVTKTQEMIEDEVAMRSSLNPYKLICDMFIREFCLPVYD